MKDLEGGGLGWSRPVGPQGTLRGRWGYRAHARFVPTRAVALARAGGQGYEETKGEEKSGHDI